VRSNLTYLIIRRMRKPMFVLVVTFGISILGMVLIPGVDSEGNAYHLTFFDAFYFVSYMATTIGFGESPYDFTYQQKLWVGFSIYLSVIGWFYAIGAIITLIQDKLLASEIALSVFQRKIRKLNEPFIIFVGYTSFTKAIIDRLTDDGIHSVVIEKDEERLKLLMLEDYVIEVPALNADIRDPEAFKTAGIHKRNCQAVITLFEDDAMNLRAALSAKLMNKEVTVIAEATTQAFAENLKTVGTDIVENPFKIVAKRVYFSLKAPSLLILEQWLYGETLVARRKDRLPREGRYVICGYGRMGQALQKGLDDAGMDYFFIDSDPERIRAYQKDDHIIHGSGIDDTVLLKAGIEEASCIVAATRDDFFNLSIILAARRINPEIFTIARENRLNDSIVFNAANIDRIIMLENIIVAKTHMILARPLADRFIRTITARGEEWAERAIRQMAEEIDHTPDPFETIIDDAHAYALTRRLRSDDKAVPLKTLYRSLRDHSKRNPVIALYLRRNGEETLLPDPDLPLMIGDELFFAGKKEAFEEMEYILENVYELDYALSSP
jgi:voltage-gated potassium channel